MCALFMVCIIETSKLTDADLLPGGILCNRTKGSRTNITEWNDKLREAIDYLKTRRQEIRDKKKCPIPARPEDRYLFVSESGTPLVKSSLDSSWKRFITLMLKAEIIEESQRFGLHDLKRRGTTDTKGTRAEKQEAGGWKNEEMVDIYDHSIPTVKPVSE